MGSDANRPAVDNFQETPAASRWLDSGFRPHALRKMKKKLQFLHLIFFIPAADFRLHEI